MYVKLRIIKNFEGYKLVNCVLPGYKKEKSNDFGLG